MPGRDPGRSLLIRRGQSFADIAVLPEGVPAHDFLEASDGMLQLFGEDRVVATAALIDSYQDCSAMASLALSRQTSAATLQSAPFFSL
jgi:hypothetical protein